MNALKHLIYPDLNDQQQFRLNKINEIKDYFFAETKERINEQKAYKYITSFDYFNKSLIVVSVTTGSLSIASFAIFIGAHVRMASASFSFAFSISTEIVKKMLKTMQNKKK